MCSLLAIVLSFTVFELLFCHQLDLKSHLQKVDHNCSQVRHNFKFDFVQSKEMEDKLSLLSS